MKGDDRSGPAPASVSADDVATIDLVREALRGLRYGQVVLTVHDGAVAQIERTEKLRPPRR